MKRVFTATCLAATFAVGLAAQSTGTAGTAGTTPQDPQAGGQRGGGPRTVTGCLRAGDTAGTYMLTDVTMQGGAGRAGAGSGTTAGGTGATAGGTGATAGGTATGTAATGGATASGAQGAPMSVMLTAADASVDLKAHVGHKMEVVGTMAGGRGRSGDTGAGATGTGQGGGRGPRNMTVTSVRMISESCS